MTARSSGSRRLKARSSWSRSAIADVCVGDGGEIGDVVHVDIEATAAGPPDLVDAGVDDQATQPGVESVRVAQRGQITPGTDERVLDGVRRAIGIPEHEPGGRIEAGDRGACQLGEGVMIASPRSLHEVSRHHGPQAVARLMWPRSRVWRARHRPSASPWPDDARRPAAIGESAAVADRAEPAVRAPGAARSARSSVGSRAACPARRRSGRAARSARVGAVERARTGRRPGRTAYVGAVGRASACRADRDVTGPTTDVPTTIWSAVSDDAT